MILEKRKPIKDPVTAPAIAAEKAIKDHYFDSSCWKLVLGGKAFMRLFKQSV